MEAWAPRQHSVARCLESWDAKPTPLLLRSAELLLSACRLASGAQALPGEPGCTRWACVSNKMLLSVCQVMPTESVCGLARLRYSQPFMTASCKPPANIPQHVRPGAHAALPLTHPWVWLCTARRSIPANACATASKQCIRPQPARRCEI
jgi:hypothetical protein